MYTVVFDPGAMRDVDRLPAELQDTILDAIYELAREPRPSRARMLVDAERALRIRVGQYRVIYVVDDDRGKIIIRAVGHRREIYC